MAGWILDSSNSSSSTDRISTTWQFCGAKPQSTLAVRTIPGGTFVICSAGHENAFAKLKTILRKTAARTIPKLWDAVRDALPQFKPDQCANMFTAAGYSMPTMRHSHRSVVIAVPYRPALPAACCE